MTPLWDDVNARARGLGTHLLDVTALESLGRESDISGLAAALRRHGVLTAATAEVPSAEAIELALRRWAGAMLRIIGRWAGPRVTALPLVFDDEDRRSLRAIFRGAAQRAPAMTRLAGLIPTPFLPERALEELAHAATPELAGSLLSAWRHPYAEAILPVTATPQPDLLAFEVAISRAYAQRLAAAASRSRSGAVRAFVAESIDLENATTALALAGNDRDIIVRETFLAGGTDLLLAGFERAIKTGTAEGARAELRSALARTPYATAFAPGTTWLEDELLRLRLQSLGDRVRQAPLDALTTIWFALRLRAQLIDLQRILWTVMLNGPRAALHDMITAAA